MSLEFRTGQPSVARSSAAWAEEGKVRKEESEEGGKERKRERGKEGGGKGRRERGSKVGCGGGGQNLEHMQTSDVELWNSIIPASLSLMRLTSSVAIGGVQSWQHCSHAHPGTCRHTHTHTMWK